MNLRPTACKADLQAQRRSFRCISEVHDGAGLLVEPQARRRRAAAVDLQAGSSFKSGSTAKQQVSIAQQAKHLLCSSRGSAGRRRRQRCCLCADCRPQPGTESDQALLCSSEYQARLARPLREPASGPAGTLKSAQEHDFKLLVSSRQRDE